MPCQFPKGGFGRIAGLGLIMTVGVNSCRLSKRHDNGIGPCVQ